MYYIGERNTNFCSGSGATGRDVLQEKGQRLNKKKHFKKKRRFSGKYQNDLFKEFFAVLKEHCDFKTVLYVYYELSLFMENHDFKYRYEQKPHPLELAKSDIMYLFKQSKVPEKCLSKIEELYSAYAGERSFLADNIACTKELTIEASDIFIKINPEKIPQIITGKVSGCNSIIIFFDDNDNITVNDVQCHLRCDDEYLDLDDFFDYWVKLVDFIRKLASQHNLDMPDAPWELADLLDEWLKFPETEIKGYIAQLYEHWYQTIRLLPLYKDFTRPDPGVTPKECNT